MKHFLLATIFALLACTIGTIAEAATLDTSAIDTALGRTGQAMDGVYRVGFPRSDLHVSVGSVSIAPGLALGGYAAFIPQATGVLAVGDLVLLESEIQPVMDSLKGAGFEITALHNHLRGESPHVMYMHFMAVGDGATLARQLHTALSLSRTPPGPPTASAPQTLTFEAAIEEGLGRKGRVSGAILSVSAPRAEAITMNGMSVPPAAGVATAMNFQDAGNGNVATTGDFVLIASEVEPVQRTLLTHGFEVTALHHHMLDDNPHLYYMHFWAVQPPAAIAAALREALTHTNVKQ